MKYVKEYHPLPAQGYTEEFWNTPRKSKIQEKIPSRNALSKGINGYD